MDDSLAINVKKLFIREHRMKQVVQSKQTQ